MTWRSGKTPSSAWRRSANQPSSRSAVRRRATPTPDGKNAVSTGDAVRVWDVETGKQVRAFGENLCGFALGMSADGKQILCNDMPARTVRLWDVETGKEVQKFQ